MSMKSSNDTIGNRTRDLSVCSVVPQPTVPPCTPILYRKRFHKSTLKTWRRCEILWSYLPYFKETKSVGLITYSQNNNAEMNL
jgi:hypothetical protein